MNDDGIDIENLPPPDDVDDGDDDSWLTLLLSETPDQRHNRLERAAERRRQIEADLVELRSTIEDRRRHGGEALLAPVRVLRSGETVMFRMASNQADVTLIWPRGFSARLVAGRVEIVAPDGAAIAREEDLLANVLGGAGDAQGFHTCSVRTGSIRRRRSGATPGSLSSL